MFSYRCFFCFSQKTFGEACRLITKLSKMTAYWFKIETWHKDNTIYFNFTKLNKINVT